jgi:YD repeat-containing protein
MKKILVSLTAMIALSLLSFNVSGQGPSIGHIQGDVLYPRLNETHTYFYNGTGNITSWAITDGLATITSTNGDYVTVNFFNPGNITLTAYSSDGVVYHRNFYVNYPDDPEIEVHSRDGNYFVFKLVPWDHIAYPDPVWDCFSGTIVATPDNKAVIIMDGFGPVMCIVNGGSYIAIYPNEYLHY